MHCPNCGGESTGGRFCKFCGSELPQAAPQTIPQPVSQPTQGYYAPNMVQPPQQPQYAYPNPYRQPAIQKKENPILGIIGAFLGSLIGAASIVLLYQINLVASFSGLLLAFCTLKGYELLGKRLGGFGIVFCVILMLVMPFAAYLVSVTIEIMPLYEAGFLDTFSFVTELLFSGEISFGDILADLGMLYFFVVLGGASTIATAIRANKK